MADDMHLDKRFGELAIEKQWITQDNIDRALVIRQAIFNRTKVHTPIGRVLQKMGLMAEEQVSQILAEQKDGSPSPDGSNAPVEPEPIHYSDVFDLRISDDKITASLMPTGIDHRGVTIDDIHAMLAEQGITEGVVSDDLILAYLESKRLPLDPIKIATGIAPVAGEPPEVQFHFDTDPMRIGTLKEDGTMDWKNRGDIPQVAVGDVLVEKVGGTPGTAGINVFGEEVPPPKIKDIKLKTNKGAQVSPDGLQITAKASGMPKLEADGRVAVYSVLPIEGDIGIETGHVEFDGYIDVKGSVTSGYHVKGKSLSATEIQNATIIMSEDVVSYGGIYGSTIKADGSLKANHIHHCTIELIGDLVVEREIFGCTIETNGQVLITNGKIIASKIGAKKGIQTKDVGTQASKPSELIVGIDHKMARDIKALKAEMAELETQKAEAQANVVKHRARVDELDVELGLVAQEQDAAMVQKRQLEEKLDGPNPIENPQKRQFLTELIAELADRYNELDKRVHTIMSQDEQVRGLIDGLVKMLTTIDQDVEKIKEDINAMEEAAILAPGIPVVKANGTVFTKTLVVGPHKKLSIPKEMKQVRIAESRDDDNQYQIKISALR